MLPRRTIKRLTRLVLKSERVRRNNTEVSFVFVNDRVIKHLNKQYFHKNSPTDVIAFPIEQVAISDKRKNSNILGDVVICVDEARRNSSHFGTSVRYELCLYAVHGLLHLLGYDDIRASDRKKMEARQVAILKSLNIT